MAIDVVTRDEWGARKPKSSYVPLKSTKGVKVHYTGGRVDPAIVDDHDKCVAMVRSIQNYHMDGNGWIDIGYSAVACPHRKVFIGRGPHHLPAANGAGLNSGHYAVLGLVGTSGLVQPPDDMLNGIVDAIEYFREKGDAGDEIKGHRDGYPTDCPGDILYAWVRKGAPRPSAQEPTGPGDDPEPGPHAPEWPGRLLRYPPVMRGDDVRTWQARMAELGYEIDVDGAYGPLSREVCRAFQRDHDLDVDGIVGPITWQAAFRPVPAGDQDGDDTNGQDTNGQGTSGRDAGAQGSGGGDTSGEDAGGQDTGGAGAGGADEGVRGGSADGPGDGPGDTTPGGAEDRADGGGSGEESGRAPQAPATRGA